VTNTLLPYDVLLIDDQPGPTSWGQITKSLLEDYEYKVKHVTSVNEAKQEIFRLAYDILIIDLDLQSPIDGIDLQKELRSIGLRQPIILVSGNIDYLQRPIADYADALALGPISFYDKRSRIGFVGVVREVSNRVDPIRRVLRLMRDAGLGDKTFNIEGRQYSVKEILEAPLSSDDLVRSLRESLYALMLELQTATMIKK
jgi:DNA-binding NtrC family response regulator